MGRPFKLWRALMGLVLRARVQPHSMIPRLRGSKNKGCSPPSGTAKSTASLLLGELSLITEDWMLGTFESEHLPAEVDKMGLPKQ
eukprot:scaffold234991_cov23-Tisochrysis_lutea.AAC.1